jgi:hypothetical protein
MGRLNIQTKYGKTITDAVWFSNPTLPSWKVGERGCIGIVTVEWGNTYNKFIGMGGGISEEEDAILISDWGSLFEEGTK